MPNYYRNQTAWKQIQPFLPAAMHFTPEYQPEEEWWDWQGHSIHLDRFPNPQSKAKVLLLHGVGTNGRQLSMILGGALWKRGYETVAADAPGYGLTVVNPKCRIVYDDWVDMVDALIQTELARDDKPLILYGLSAGGMLAYHATVKNPRIAGIVGMTFLDQRESVVRDGTALNWLISRVGVPFARLVANTPLGHLKMPMRLASKMHYLVNNPAALKVFLKDKTSAGNWVSIAFLSSYMHYQPAIEPEDFAVCPILLTQPAADRWTPLAFSEPFLNRIHQVRTEIVMLDNAGHYPLEPSGLEQMEESIVTFIERVTDGTEDSA
ncbi:alpha/beta hydrolase [filamentous cyanobacterium LEGE 11480]|uniref:Alpha/beta hydrolase n=1 Tax=Romeriopsis navalis LEGE 11480 TaxID=2777977 RepID=A0A928Z4P2_9CYAN|nr:alpha/beta hydrolase [Romeriopsis navalis]MBE9031232.1 alpha/beta hydrolase [Romeriopsis navalis LEGE 11480]